MVPKVVGSWNGSELLIMILIKDSVSKEINNNNK